MNRSRPDEALATAAEIGGLGPAGASGLLAVLFPNDFGAVDQFVVDALYRVTGLPERTQVASLHARLFPEQHGLGNSVRALQLGDAAWLVGILRRQARDLNARFHSTDWTPRRVDMALWGDRRP